jgi:hypothetical protein
MLDQREQEWSDMTSPERAGNALTVNSLKEHIIAQEHGKSHGIEGCRRPPSDAFLAIKQAIFGSDSHDHSSALVRYFQSLLNPHSRLTGRNDPGLRSQFSGL